MFDLISIGDSVIDTFVPLSDLEVETKDEGSFLKLPLGDKVPVGQSVSVIGGNAANNAVGSARLKLKVAIYTCVGKMDDDEADERIVSKFKKEGVDLSYIHHDPKFPSNHNIILNFKDERVILTHHQAWDYSLPDFDQAKWVYLTSLAPSYLESNIVEQLLNFLERNGGKLAFQPGTFQLKAGLKKNAQVLSLAEVLILNLEEAKLLLGFEEAKNIPVKKLLQSFLDLGPKKVVITDGKNGSYGAEGESFLKLETFPAKIIQTTGAGDAYSTGLVAGLIYGEDLAEAMRWGNANSASVIEQIGPQTGLLTYNKLQERLKHYSGIIAKQL